MGSLDTEFILLWLHDIPNTLKTLWKEFSEMIKNLITQKDPKMRRRFRRLIPPERIVRLADMLYGLSSEENYRNIKKNL